MPTAKPRHRVAIMDSLQHEGGYEVVRSVLDYGHHIGHWEFVGLGSTPFIALGMLKTTNVDGVVGEFSEPEDIPRVLAIGAAVVNISTVLADLPFACVGNDDEATGRMGAEHLLERGFTHLAFLGSDAEWRSHRRLAGFREAVTEAGRTCHTRTYAGELGDDPRQLIPVWLAELPKPIGIMAYQDFLARLTINAAVNLGLRVPDDVAVLGVYNNRWTSILAALPVSSIELDMHRIGTVAAETLDGLMSGGAPPPPRWIPPVGVVTRRSTDITLVADELVTEALAYIRDHCGEGLSVDDVMERVDVSRRSMEKRMKQAVGLTPQAAIFRAQIDRAKHLLTTTQTPIENISRACGFRQPARLNQVFKRTTGMTPSQYRRQGTTT